MIVCAIWYHLQFKKREKHLWRSVIFGLLKVTSSTGVFNVFKTVQMVPNCAKHNQVDCALSIDNSKRDGVCTSIRFNFLAQNTVEIRFSDNPWQQETTNDIIWLGEKCVIYRLDIIFSITHVSKINLFCRRDIRRYPQMDIGRKIPNFIPCQEPEKWEWLIVSM